VIKFQTKEHVDTRIVVVQQTKNIEIIFTNPDRISIVATSARKHLGHERSHERFRSNRA